jgi:hypothetical protein
MQPFDVILAKPLRQVAWPPQRQVRESTTAASHAQQQAQIRQSSMSCRQQGDRAQEQNGQGCLRSGLPFAEELQPVACACQPSSGPNQASGVQEKAPCDDERGPDCASGLPHLHGHANKIHIRPADKHSVTQAPGVSEAQRTESKAAAENLCADLRATQEGEGLAFSHACQEVQIVCNGEASVTSALKAERGPVATAGVGDDADVDASEVPPGSVAGRAATGRALQAEATGTPGCAGDAGASPGAMNATAGRLEKSAPEFKIGWPCEKSTAQDSDGDLRSVGALKWRIPPATANISADAIAYQWIGPDEGTPALTELLMTLSGATWGFFNPTSGEARHGMPEEMKRRLMRRFFLLEKAKEAAIVGILVGTLALPSISKAMSTLRLLAKRAGKRTYTVIMGKPNPYKLANFSEVCVHGRPASSVPCLMKRKFVAVSLCIL